MPLKEKLQKILDERRQEGLTEETERIVNLRRKQQEERIYQSWLVETKKIVNKKFVPILKEVNHSFLKGRGRIEKSHSDYPEGYGDVVVELEWDIVGSNRRGSASSIKISVDTQDNVDVQLGNKGCYLSNRATEEWINSQGVKGVMRNPKLSDNDLEEKIEDVIVEGLREGLCRYEWEPPDTD
jgi:hypothetical protein